MTRLRWFLFSLLFCGTAFGQTIPNGNTPFTSGQVWTLTQWDTAWQAKAIGLHRQVDALQKELDGQKTKAAEPNPK